MLHWSKKLKERIEELEKELKDSQDYNTLLDIENAELRASNNMLIAENRDLIYQLRQNIPAPSNNDAVAKFEKIINDIKVDFELAPYLDKKEFAVKEEPEKSVTLTYLFEDDRKFECVVVDNKTFTIAYYEKGQMTLQFNIGQLYFDKIMDMFRFMDKNATERPIDLGKYTVRDINCLIDEALDKRDYDKIKILSEELQKRKTF